jgi:tetratricopeptide (TPR) repeat protein
MDNLYHFYEIHSQFQEGQEAFARAAERFKAHVLLPSQSKARSPLVYLPGQAKSEIVLANMLARQGAFCTYLGLYRLARALLQESLMMARPLEMKQEMAFCFNFLGDILQVQGKHIEAKQLYQESLALYRELGNQEGIILPLLGLSWASRYLGEYIEAKQGYQECLTIGRQLGHPLTIARSLANLGLVSFIMGEYTESVQYNQESLAIFKEIGNQLGIAKSLRGLGMATWGLEEANVTEAKQFFEESLAVSREIGDRYPINICLRYLSHIANSLGAYQEAQQYGQEAVTIAKDMDALQEVARNVICLGETACSRGDFQTARQYLREALILLTTIKNTLYLPDVLVFGATLLAQEGESLAQDDRSREEKKEQALELLTLVVRHPAGPQLIKDKAARLLAQLMVELPPGVVAAAQAQGQARNLEEAAEILAEWSLSPAAETIALAQTIQASCLSPPVIGGAPPNLGRDD